MEFGTGVSGSETLFLYLALNSRTMDQPVRVRFAPSPTGYLHVGGLRTALYNYLFARRNGGVFVLRIEDTDQARRVEGAVENLIATLDWAGVRFDEGPGREGVYGPYVQSQRLDIYRAHAEELISKGLAYRCFCTTERLEEVRQRQNAAKLSTSYDRHCRNLSPGEVQRHLSAGERNVIRMKVPLEGALTFEDIIRGSVTIAYDVLDDQVIIKSDGFPTYHLAVVVDDHLMAISHVIRGEEWLPSTPKHILLYNSFGWELPKFAHLPLLLNPDKSKLSKRQGDVAVEDYRAKGYFKEAIVNFVAFLGWNPGDEREIFSMEDLVREFTLERVGKSGAVFNVEKLNWLNFEYLKGMPEMDVLGLLKLQLAQSSFAGQTFGDEYLLTVIRAMRERASFIKDFIEKGGYFFERPAHYDQEVVKKRWRPESAAHLQSLCDAFGTLQNPTKEDYEGVLHKTAETLSVKNSELIHPLRLVVSGVGSGPGLFDILAILGKDETVQRIKIGIEKIR
jgi:glutamyl-tRNA synthetase